MKIIPLGETVVQENTACLVPVETVMFLAHFGPASDTLVPMK